MFINFENFFHISLRSDYCEENFNNSNSFCALFLPFITYIYILHYVYVNFVILKYKIFILVVINQVLLHQINCKIINSSKCSIVHVLRDYRIANDLISAYFVYNCKFRGNAWYERDFAINGLNDTHIRGQGNASRTAA